MRWILRAFPKQFRERHGEDLLRLYADLYGPGFSLRAAADALWSGLAARAGAAPASFEDWMERPARQGGRERLLHAVRQDVRYGLRSLKASPGFTLAILFTLALGIGANTAIFSVIDAVLLRPLPYANGERMVHLLQPAAGPGVENVGFSPLEVQDYREQSRALDAVVEYHSMPFILLGGAEPQRVQTGVVSANFFEAFGVRPLLGRGFQPGDEGPSATPVLVLSSEYWNRTYRGDPNIVGKTFTMNDKVHTVIGVLPAIPQYPGVNDVYMPTSACPFRSGQHWPYDRTARGLSVFGRMRPGVSLAAARADLTGIADRLHHAYPDAYPERQGFGAGAATLRDELTRRARPTLLVLLAAAGFLLIIVCANVANLTLARLVHREREMAVRTALGATRTRLLRQLLTEGLLVALLGGVLGLGVAAWGLDALAAFAARFTTRAGEIHLDGRVLLFALGISLGTGLMLGCLPALPARASLASDLKDGGSSTGRSSRLRLRGALIVSQVAVSFTLLIGAGLMLRSLFKLQQVSPGFDAENVLTARVDLNWTRYDKPEKTIAFGAALLERLRQEPGVLSVAVADDLPLNGGTPYAPGFEVEGRTTTPGEPQHSAEIRIATPDYFRAVGIPLMTGRAFADTDKPPAANAVLINQALLRHQFAGQDPIGRRITFDRGKTWNTIVGVVADVKQHGLEREPADEVYTPFAVNPDRDLRVIVRGKAAPLSMARAVRDAVRDLDPAQPITDVRTLEQIRSEALASPRLTAVLLGAFAALALAITAAGIAGVVAYTVSQRTHEIGIRMALGAQRGEVLAMVVRQGMGRVLLGLALGVFGGFALSRAMAGLVFGIAASDPVTFVVVAGVLAAVGALACFLPARRATEVDPMIALRSA